VGRPSADTIAYGGLIVREAVAGIGHLRIGCHVVGESVAVGQGSRVRVSVYILEDLVSKKNKPQYFWFLTKQYLYLLNIQKPQ
jgi:hypothetical protein